MDENNVVNSVNDGGYSVTTSSDDSMFTSLVKLLFVVVIGGLVVKCFKKFVNWVKDGQRLRREEKLRKEADKINELAEKKAQEKLDSLLAKEVKESEKTSEENK